MLNSTLNFQEFQPPSGLNGAEYCAALTPDEMFRDCPDSAPPPPAANDPADPVDRAAELKRLRQRLRCTAEGNVYGHLDNAMTALESGGGTLYPRLQYNELSAKVELIPVSTGKPTTVIDEHRTELRKLLIEDFGSNFGKDDVRDAVDAIARRNKYNPVQQYLRSLAWDGTPRIDSWLIRLANAEDTPYVRCASKYTLLGLVERGLRPGCKQDYTLILEGITGQSKTEFVKALAANPDWFAEVTLNPRDMSKTWAKSVGHWVLEMGELRGFSQADEEEVKHYLTVTHDNNKKLYKNYELFPRTFCYIGTTNSDDWLHWRTGGRRFLPVWVEKLDVAGLIAERDQLMAEAVATLGTATAFSHCPDIEKLAAPEQEQRRPVYPWESDLEDFLERMDKEGREAIATDEIYEALFPLEKKRVDMKTQKLVATVMRKHPWERPTNRDAKLRPDGGLHKGKPKRGYRRVGASEASAPPDPNPDPFDS